MVQKKRIRLQQSISKVALSESFALIVVSPTFQQLYLAGCVPLVPLQSPL